MPENLFKFKMYFDISKSHDVKIPQNSEILAIFLILAIIDREPHSHGLVGNDKVGFCTYIQVLYEVELAVMEFFKILFFSKNIYKGCPSISSEF